MPREVKTTATWTCDRCGFVAPAAPLTIVAGWTGIRVLYAWEEGTTGDDRFSLASSGYFCPSCTALVREAMERKPQ